MKTRTCSSACFHDLVIINLMMQMLLMVQVQPSRLSCSSKTLDLYSLLFTGLPVWQTQSGSAFNLFVTGLPVWQTQSRSAFSLFDLFYFFFFFAVSVKVLPVTPLVSGVFVEPSARIFLGSRG